MSFHSMIHRVQRAPNWLAKAAAVKPSFTPKCVSPGARTGAGSGVGDGTAVGAAVGTTTVATGAGGVAVWLPTAHAAASARGACAAAEIKARRLARVSQRGRTAAPAAGVGVSGIVGTMGGRGT